MEPIKRRDLSFRHPQKVLIAFCSHLFLLLIAFFLSLYNHCQWDDKAIRRLVGDGKLASRTKGEEDRTPEINQECPICFLYYKDTNVTKCCNASICTECFLQVRPQKEKHSSCPFCNSHKLNVSVAKKMTAEQLQELEKEEQLVIEARIRSQSIGENSESGENNGSETFGSSLQQDARVALMRARSESFASNNSAEHGHQKENIMSLAMTPEERRRLEEEMKAQLSHPLTMRVEAEAVERRIRNERAYSRTSGGSSPRELRAQTAAELFRRRRRGGRDWNQIVDAFERGGNGEIHSLDDLVVLEAAILLSMDEESRQARQEESFDAARHARDGFPLVRSFFANCREDGSEATRGSSSVRRRQQVLNTIDGGSTTSSSGGNTALDTAAMLMRGISEEDQMAMAIAASLQDQNSNSEETEEGNNNESQNDEEVNSDDEDLYLDDGADEDGAEDGVESTMLETTDDDEMDDFADGGGDGELVTEEAIDGVGVESAEEKGHPEESPAEHS